MKGNWLLVMMAAASLMACGKSEEAAVAPPAEAPAQVAEPAAPPMPEAAAPAPAPEAEPPAAAPAAPATPAQAATAQPAPAPAPTPAKPAPKAPEAAPASKAAPTPAPAPAPATKADLGPGQQVYTKACAFCHDKGIAGAPKIGDAAAWGPRLGQGMDGLYTAAIKGKGAMPAKGGNPALSDAEVKAAVDYLVAKSR